MGGFAGVLEERMISGIGFLVASEMEVKLCAVLPSSRHWWEDHGLELSAGCFYSRLESEGELCLWASDIHFGHVGYDMGHLCGDGQGVFGCVGMKLQSPARSRCYG